MSIVKLIRVESFSEGVTPRLQFDPLNDVEFWCIALVVYLLVSLLQKMMLNDAHRAVNLYCKKIGYRQV